MDNTDLEKAVSNYILEQGEQHHSNRFWMTIAMDRLASAYEIYATIEIHDSIPDPKCSFDDEIRHIEFKVRIAKDEQLAAMFKLEYG